MANLLDDEYGNTSMSRLLLLGSFLVSSAIMLIQAVKPEGISEGLMIAYLAPFASAYVGRVFASAKSGQS